MPWYAYITVLNHTRVYFFAAKPTLRTFFRAWFSVRCSLIADLPRRSMLTTDSSVDTPSGLSANDLCNRLSPFFRVGKTVYGGRGCFASSNISIGTLIYECGPCLASTIIRPFRKEVCTFCFHYDNGNALKSRITQKVGKDVMSLFFCSNKCVGGFAQHDLDQLLEKSLFAVEREYLRTSALLEPEPEQPPHEVLDGDFQAFIDHQWEAAEAWNEVLSRTKSSKRQKLIPRISTTEYAEAKYVLTVIFQVYKNKHRPLPIPQVPFGELSPEERMCAELRLFETLQSTTDDKVKRYPYLLHSYINIFKFVRLVALPELELLITPEAVRTIIGRNLLNAFGIWSRGTSEAEEKEYFGFGVFPLASFFNHSCDPNVKKTRNGNSLLFHIKRPVSQGEELCIDYGNYLHESLQQRQLELKEWFFDCGCLRCVEESARGDAWTIAWNCTWCREKFSLEWTIRFVPSDIIANTPTFSDPVAVLFGRAPILEQKLRPRKRYWDLLVVGMRKTNHSYFSVT